MDKKEQLAYFGLLIMTLIIGLSFIFIKIGLRYSSPVDLLAHRFTAAALSLFVLWMLGYVKMPRLNIKKTKSLLLLSLFYPMLFFALQTFGMQYSSASEAGIIFATTPIITLIAAGFFLKEKTTWLQKMGVVLSIAGIVYISYFKGNASNNTSPLGLLLLLLSVFSITVYYILGKFISAHFSTIEITVWMTLLAFLVFNGFSLVVHFQNNTVSEFFKPLNNVEFIWTVLYLGVLSSMFTSLLTNFALTKIPASQIAVINNLSPIIAIAGGVLILGETLFAFHIIGGLLVLSGVAMTIFYKKKHY